MSVKQCLTFGDHTKIKNATGKNKSMSMAKQKMAEKQDKMFYDLGKDSGFQKEISGLKRMDKITAIQKKYAQNGVQITRQQVNKMMKNGVTIIKPLPIVMPKTTAMLTAIPRVSPKIVSIPKEIVPEIKPIPKAPPVVAFQEAKTLDEALKRCEKYFDEPINWTGCGLGNFQKLQALNTINKQMENIGQWTGGRRMRFLSIYDGKEDWFGFVDKNTSMFLNHLRVNQRLDFIAKEAKSFSLLKANRFSVSGNNAAAALRHEMGHAMYYEARNTVFFEKFEDKFDGIKKVLIENNISKYAARSVDEFFAEAFTIYSSPKFKVSSLNKVFGDGFEELMERILTGAK